MTCGLPACIRGAAGLAGAAIAVLVWTTPRVEADQASAQVPQQTFRTTAELVQVDATVLDANGRPVRGLRREDFVLLDGGERRAIEAFTAVSHEWEGRPEFQGPAADVPRDVGDNSRASAERLVVLIIDDANVWKERVPLVTGLARRIVERLGAEASMAVVFTRGEGSIEITEDRAALLAAIDSLEGQLYWNRTRAGGFETNISLDLPPSRYQIRASAVSDRLDRSGSVYLPLVVPEVPKDDVAAAGLAVGRVGAPVGVTLSEPDLLPFDPVLDRVFDASETIHVAYRLARRRVNGTLSATLDIVDSEGTTVTSSEQSFGTALDAGPTVVVPLAALPPGAYRLRVQARDEKGSSTREIGFAIRPR